MDYKKIIKVVFDKSEVTEGVKELQNKINKLKIDIDAKVDTSKAKAELKDLEKQLNDINKAAEENSVSGMFSKMSESFKAGNIRQGLGELTGLIGKIPVGLAVAGTAAVAFVGALGAGFMAAVQRSAALNKELRDIKNVLKLNTKEAIAFNAQINVISDNFGKEAKELTQASKQVSKAFGIEAKAALDLIQKGLIDGADANGDFLDNIEEYGVYFKEAGYTAEEFFGIVAAGSEAGIYNDKLPDAIKELNINLKDSARLAKALKGNFSDAFNAELTNGIKTGAISTKDALNLISEEMKTAGLNAFQMESLWSNLFAAIGEDVGSAKILMDAINNGLFKANAGLQGYGSQQLVNQKIQEELNKQTDTLANTLGGPINKGMTGLMNDGKQFLSTLFGWVNAFNQIEVSIDKIRVKQQSKNIIAFQESEMNKKEKPRDARELLKAQNEELAVRKKKLEDLQLLANNAGVFEKWTANIKIFAGTSQEVTYSWETLANAIRDSEEDVAALTEGVAALDALVGSMKPISVTDNNDYQKNRANIIRQSAIDVANAELAEMRKVDDIYYEGLDKRFEKESALTRKKYANEIAIANSQAVNLVKTHAGVAYANGQITAKEYAKARQAILDAGDAAGATDEQKKKANDLRAAEAAGAKATLDQKAALREIEDEMYNEKAERLIKERDLTMDIYMIKKDMMSLDMKREGSQTSDLERQLELIQEQAEAELEKLMLKRKQKEEDMLMKRMEGKEKYDMLTKGTVTQPELMFKDGLEVKSKTLSQDLTDLEEAYTVESGRSRTSMTSGFQRAITNPTAGAGGGGAPPAGGAPTATADQTRLFQLANLLQTTQTALNRLFSTGAVDSSGRDSSGQVVQEAKDRNDLIKQITALMNSMNAGTGSSWRAGGVSGGFLPAAQTLIRALDPIINPPGGGTPSNLPQEVQLELMFASEEFDSEVEKIRQNMNAATLEALSNYYNGLGNMTKTYIDEWGNKMKDFGEEKAFEPLSRYFKNVEENIANRKLAYKDLVKQIIQGEGSIFHKIKTLGQAFLYGRGSQTDKYKMQIDQEMELLIKQNQFKIKLVREESEEALSRNKETSKTILDDLRDKQNQEIRLMAKLRKEDARSTTTASRRLEIQTELSDARVRELAIIAKIADQDTSIAGMAEDQRDSLENRLEVLANLEMEYGGDIVKMDEDMAQKRIDIQADLTAALADTTPEGRERAEMLKKMLWAYRQLGTEEARILRESYNKKTEITKEEEEKLNELRKKKLLAWYAVLHKNTENLGKALSEGIQPAAQQIVALIDMYAEAESKRLTDLIDTLSTQIDAVNEQISITEDRISNIEGDLGEASGQRREDLLSQYDAQRNGLAALQMQEQKAMDQKRKFEEDKAKLDAESAKRQEAMNALTMVATTINMIASVAEIAKANAKLVFPANVIAIGASIAAVTSAFMAAKSIFKFEKGGLVDNVMKNGGMLQGPRHSQGGIPIEAEGGEYIMSREAVSRIGIDKLNGLNFNKNIKSLTNTPINTKGLTTSLPDNNSAMIDAMLALANRPSVVSVEDIMSSSDRVNRVKVNSRF